jgi:hypothetical protein
MSGLTPITIVNPNSTPRSEQRSIQNLLNDDDRQNTITVHHAAPLYAYTSTNRKPSP